MNNYPRTVEAQLIQRVLQRRYRGSRGGSSRGRASRWPGLRARPLWAGDWAERLIAVVAIAVTLLVLGSYLQELMWAALAAGATLSLGSN